MVKLRVLVVEDNEDTARSMAILLRHWGHDVRIARDGPAAVREATDYTPDVVLLDIGLPGMDGWEVARRIKGLSETRKPIFIAVTGYGTEEDHIRSAEAGIHFHFLKPVDPEVLKMLLDGWASAG